MVDVLFSIDLWVFYAVNHALQNVLFDVLMPFLTDLNKKPVILATVVIVWLWLMVRGGPTGRAAGIVLVVTIAFSDQLNSSWIKHLFERERPCHVLNDVHLLVPCGSGYAFPSSHAVNNFAGAVVLTYFYRRLMWAFLTFAAVVAFSRVYVGVHYPSDVLAGALLGAACAALILAAAHWTRELWNRYRRPLKESGS